MHLEVIAHAERPELAEHSVPSSDVWPEYNLHGDVLEPLWPRLLAEHAAFQLYLVDTDDDEVLAELHAVPCAWDGTTAGLPSGIDAALSDALALPATGGSATALCALAVEVAPASQGRGLAAVALDAMRVAARRHGLGALLAPVRPSLKARYPITPIERYVTWRRADGQLFDPWMRVHERLGAQIGPPLPRSMRITGTVAEWERWAGMAFPESGAYTFPHGLAPLEVDREADAACYHEPNVWMLHRLEG